MTKHRKSEDRTIVPLSLPPGIATKVFDTADRLGLPRSEILRRSITIGLRSFDNVTLPGTEEIATPEG